MEVKLSENTYPCELKHAYQVYFGAARFPTDNEIDHVKYKWPNIHEEIYSISQKITIPEGVNLNKIL